VKIPSIDPMPRARRSRRGAAAALRTAVFALAAAAPLWASAEISDDPLLGAGLRSRPAYDGSASQRTELVPYLRVLGRPWFLRTTQGVLEGGVRFEIAPGLNAGAQLAFEPGRDNGESDFLDPQDLASVKRGASVGVQLEWDHRLGPMPVTLLTRVRRNTDATLGTQADVRLSAGVLANGRFAAGVYAQAIWADARSSAAHYGITPLQSASTGLPAYAAGNGWQSGSVGLLGSVELSRDWVVLGSLESRRLQGNAAHSPLAERRSNRYLSAGIAFRY
jgi:outer membrane scaffolding protein for murein synthesis (MipA/OmpV family)